MFKFLTIFFLISCSLFAGKFDEHIGEDALKYVQTPEDRRMLGFFSALFYMGEKRESPAGAIPKTLHFIWLGPKPFSKESVDHVKGWIDLHPGWKVKFWTDLGQAAPDDRMEVHSFDRFPLQELQECYYQCDNFGERSEICRYAILLEEGGVYVDHDVQCLKPIDPLQETHDFFCGLDPLGPTVLSSSVNPSPHLLASTPQHPILKTAKRWLIDKWEELETQYIGSDPSAVYNRVLHRGYRSLGVGIKEAHNRSSRKDVVFPPDFFSLPDRKEAIFAMHRHLGSWHHPQPGGDRKVEKLFKEIKEEFSRTFSLALSLTAINVGLGAFLIYPLLRKKKREKK
ncbi:MAG: glycosyltransferase [Rhabdochlamydiaceae bacterium]